jgi:hypothetical protein
MASLAAAIAHRSGDPCIAGVVTGNDGMSPPDGKAFDTITERHGMQVAPAGEGDIGASEDDLVVLGDWRTFATVMGSPTHPPEQAVVWYHSALSAAASSSPDLDALLLHREVARVFTTGSPVADLSRSAPGTHIDLGWPHDPLPALRRGHAGPVRRIVVTDGVEVPEEARSLSAAEPLSARLAAVRHADGALVSGSAPDAAALLLEAVAAGTPAALIGDHPDASWLPEENPRRGDDAAAGAALASIGAEALAAAQNALLDRFAATEEQAAAAIVASDEGGNDGA